MKRLFVRTTAISGLMTLAAFVVVQVYRAQPTATAQESTASDTITKKKVKSKATAKNRKPSATANVGSEAGGKGRYGDRYADRYTEPGRGDVVREVTADFNDEVPDAGPDLFPEGARTARSTPRAQTVGDPFTRQLVNEVETSSDATITAERGEKVERPSRYAPGSIGEVRDRETRITESAAIDEKPAAAGPRKKRPSSTALQRERLVEQAAERAFADETVTQRGRGVTPHRDPFGDAAQMPAQANRQPIMGHGRPGMKQLEGPQSPTLVVEKAAPEEIQVGKPAVFAIRVQNVGSVTAQGVEIHDMIPQGTHLIETRPSAAAAVDGRVSWTVGIIKPGDEATVEMELMPMAEGEIGSVATVHFASEASARTRCTRPQLAMEVSVPNEVLIGEELTLSIRISNPGTGAATGIVISENIPEQLVHPAGSELEYEVGDLKPGESRQIDLVMNTVKAGQVINLLTARGDGQLQAEQQSEFMVVAPQLELSMQGPKRRYLERQATYTVTVSNPGTAAAREVQLLTHLPKGMKFIGANNSGEYDPVTNTVHWVLEELPAKQSGKVTLTALPVEAGEQMLKVESTAERGLSAEQEEVVSVEGVAAILFQLADEADPIEVGGETTYEIKVVNQGSKAATNVQLIAVFPRQLKPRSAHGPTRDSIAGQEVRFQPLGRLPPKGETVYQIRAQGLEPGDLRVQVQLLTDEMQSPVTKEESTRVYADE
jgi:uncharacterized repeat protein (TIGR01451 family)